MFHESGRFDRVAIFIEEQLLSPKAHPFFSHSHPYKDEADFDALDRTLERLIANPDNIDVLKEQLILLSGSGDERLNRNTRNRCQS